MSASHPVCDVPRQVVDGRSTGFLQSPKASSEADHVEHRRSASSEQETDPNALDGHGDLVSQQKTKRQSDTPGAGDGDEQRSFCIAHAAQRAANC